MNFQSSMPHPNIFQTSLLSLRKHWLESVHALISEEEVNELDMM